MLLAVEKVGRIVEHGRAVESTAIVMLDGVNQLHYHGKSSGKRGTILFDVIRDKVSNVEEPYLKGMRGRRLQRSVPHEQP